MKKLKINNFLCMNFYFYFFFSIFVHIFVIFFIFHDKKNNYNFISNKNFYNYNKKNTDDVFVKFVQISDTNYKIEKNTQYINNLKNVNKQNIIRNNFKQKKTNEKVNKIITNNTIKKLDIRKNVRKHNNIIINNCVNDNAYKDIDNSDFFEINKGIKTKRDLSNIFGVSFEQKFQYNYYGLQIIKKISSCYTYDSNYKNLTALIYFKIKKDGSVYDIVVKESSGNIEYDKNIFNTIMRASPFPCLPDNYNSDFLGVFFEFKED
jgi:hypothetical protein